MSPVLERRQLPRPVDDFFAKLSSSIRNGEFTPFLGAGASSLREVSEASQPWSQMLQSILVITRHLKTKESRQFVGSFVAQRLGLSDPDLDEELRLLAKEAQPASPSGKSDAAFQDSPLTLLQIE